MSAIIGLGGCRNMMSYPCDAIWDGVQWVMTYSALGIAPAGGLDRLMAWVESYAYQLNVPVKSC